MRVDGSVARQKPFDFGSCTDRLTDGLNTTEEQCTHGNPLKH